MNPEHLEIVDYATYNYTPSTGNTPIVTQGSETLLSISETASFLDGDRVDSRLKQRKDEQSISSDFSNMKNMRRDMNETITQVNSEMTTLADNEREQITDQEHDNAMLYNINKKVQANIEGQIGNIVNTVNANDKTVRDMQQNLKNIAEDESQEDSVDAALDAVQSATEAVQSASDAGSIFDLFGDPLAGAGCVAEAVGAAAESASAIKSSELANKAKSIMSSVTAEAPIKDLMVNSNSMGGIGEMPNFLHAKKDIAISKLDMLPEFLNNPQSEYKFYYVYEKDKVTTGSTTGMGKMLFILVETPFIVVFEVLTMQGTNNMNMEYRKYIIENENWNGLKFNSGFYHKTYDCLMIIEDFIVNCKKIGNYLATTTSTWSIQDVITAFTSMVVGEANNKLLMMAQVTNGQETPVAASNKGIFPNDHFGKINYFDEMTSHARHMVLSRSKQGIAGRHLGYKSNLSGLPPPTYTECSTTIHSESRPDKIDKEYSITLRGPNDANTYWIVVTVKKLDTYDPSGKELVANMTIADLGNNKSMNKSLYSPCSFKVASTIPVVEVKCSYLEADFVLTQQGYKNLPVATTNKSTNKLANVLMSLCGKGYSNNPPRVISNIANVESWLEEEYYTDEDKTNPTLDMALGPNKINYKSNGYDVKITQTNDENFASNIKPILNDAAAQKDADYYSHINYHDV